MIGITELLLVGGILLLIFGGKHLPSLGSGLSRSIKALKKGLKEDPEKNVTPPKGKEKLTADDDSR